MRFAENLVLVVALSVAYWAGWGVRGHFENRNPQGFPDWENHNCIEPTHQVSNMDRLLDAIWMVESGGRVSVEPRMDGGSMARGPYQFHALAWQDAMEYLGEDWPYTDADDLAKARRAAGAYMIRWSSYYNRTSMEDYARIFNGGPRGWEKRETLPYWDMVKKHLEEK